eukprot:3773393-Amphidinium_carterae.2
MTEQLAESVAGGHGQGEVVDVEMAEGLLCVPSDSASTKKRKTEHEALGQRVDNVEHLEICAYNHSNNNVNNSSNNRHNRSNSSQQFQPHHPHHCERLQRIPLPANGSAAFPLTRPLYPPKGKGKGKSKDIPADDTEFVAVVRGFLIDTRKQIIETKLAEITRVVPDQLWTWAQALKSAMLRVNPHDPASALLWAGPTKSLEERARANHLSRVKPTLIEMFPPLGSDAGSTRFEINRDVFNILGRGSIWCFRAETHHITSTNTACCPLRRITEHVAEAALEVALESVPGWDVLLLQELHICSGQPSLWPAVCGNIANASLTQCGVLVAKRLLHTISEFKVNPRAHCHHGLGNETFNEYLHNHLHAVPRQTLVGLDANVHIGQTPEDNAFLIGDTDAPVAPKDHRGVGFAAWAHGMALRIGNSFLGFTPTHFNSSDGAPWLLDYTLKIVSRRLGSRITQPSLSWMH